MRTISIFILCMFLFLNCSSAQKLQLESPVQHDEVYFEKWAAAVKGLGSGINIFVPFSQELPTSIQLDSVFFRGKGTLLEKIEREKRLYVGRFNSSFNLKQDVIMSGDSNDEYGNQAPKLINKIPFELTDSECVLSYIDGNEKKYFKIKNITEKQPLHYPSGPKGQ